MLNVSIVGQGYVGLPLAIASVNAGFNVTGIDTNDQKIKILNSGRSITEDVSDIQIQSALSSSRYKVTSDFSVIKESSIIIICVPTPISEKKIPDLRFLISATTDVGKNLSKESLVIIESTIQPGTTRNLILPILEKSSGLLQDQFYLAFSPERIDPRNSKWNIKTTPKLLAGLSIKASQLAFEYYSQFINTVINFESVEVVETAKLLENSFRLVNISLINEISIFCNKLGIDVNSVIDAASTKPHGFMAFYPGIGAGGHCIPVDPLYLLQKSEEVGSPISLIGLSDKINEKMPHYFVEIADRKLGGLNGKKIIVVGVSYKPNVSDCRETPVKVLIQELKSRGSMVSWHDDLVNEWNDQKSTKLSSDFDLAILATVHDYVDLEDLGEVPVLDTRNSIL